MTKKEIVLNALFDRLLNLKGIVVKKNDALPQIIPKKGLVILRDGRIGEPNILLSPPCFIYQHRAEIEAVVQDITPADRDTRLDNLLENIGLLLQVDPTLSGLIDYMYADPPEFIEELVDGGITIKAAIIPIILEYSSTSNLT